MDWCKHLWFHWNLNYGRKEFHIRSSPIFLCSNQFVPRNWIQVRKVNFSSERVQAFSTKTLRIFSTSLIGFVHRVSNELRIWNSFAFRFSYNYLYSPVQNCLKFSAVLGTTSANSSIFILPISWKKGENALWNLWYIQGLSRPCSSQWYYSV